MYAYGGVFTEVCSALYMLSGTEVKIIATNFISL